MTAAIYRSTSNIDLRGTFDASARKLTDIAPVHASGAAHETNEHAFDPRQHSGLGLNAYGDTQTELLIPSLLQWSVAMSRISILKRSISTARAALVFVGMLSPAHAAYQHHAINIFPELPLSATTDHPSAIVTSHLPWLAPVGHRQPHQADVPRHEAVSAWERQQQQADQELDRKLIICRGC